MNMTKNEREPNMNDKEDLVVAPILMKTFSLRIGENLKSRLDRHIYLLKKLESRSNSKQRWIEDAANERLALEEKLTDQKLPKDNFLSFKLNENLCKRINARISAMRQFKISYSAKQWLLEAIYDKLDREEEKAKNLIENLVKNDSLKI